MTLSQVFNDAASGLDPASVLFTRDNPELRLNPTDAHFVDVIHTETEVLGVPTEIGHVDFYPNGGRNQPGCNQSLGNISNIISSVHQENVVVL